MGSPRRSPQSSRSSNPPILEVASNAPTEDALLRATADMLRTIDAERAACHVQRVTNGHELDMTWQMRGPQEVSYAGRLEELDRMQEQLRGGVDSELYERALKLVAPG